MSVVGPWTLLDLIKKAPGLDPIGPDKRTLGALLDLKQKTSEIPHSGQIYPRTLLKKLWTLNKETFGDSSILGPDPEFLF